MNSTHQNCCEHDKSSLTSQEKTSTIISGGILGILILGVVFQTVQIFQLKSSGANAPQGISQSAAPKTLVPAVSNSLPRQVGGC